MTWANFAVWNIRFIEQGIIWFQGSDEVFKIAWLKNCSKKNWDPASIFSSQEAVDVVKASALFRPQNRVTERNSTKSDEDKFHFIFYRWKTHLTLAVKEDEHVGRSKTKTQTNTVISTFVSLSLKRTELDKILRGEAFEERGMKLFKRGFFVFRHFFVELNNRTLIRC